MIKNTTRSKAVAIVAAARVLASQIEHFVIVILIIFYDVGVIVNQCKLK